ncbi:MAG: hypothetical protein ACRBFS_04990 [Aureispira sp.]
MFGFFKKNKPSIDSISFPTFEWELVKETKELKQWLHPEHHQSLTVNFFDLAPDLPTIKREGELRQFFRAQLIAANGGIIEVGIKQLSTYSYVKNIFKIPQEPSGITYLGSLILPFKKYSYVVKIQAIEVGTTGMRESVIMNNLMATGAIDMGENGIDGWAQDPYEPAFKEGTLMNLSEAEAYDEQFSTHPLSQIRQGLRTIEEQLVLGEQLQKIAPFER